MNFNIFDVTLAERHQSNKFLKPLKLFKDFNDNHISLEMPIESREIYRKIEMTKKNSNCDT